MTRLSAVDKSKLDKLEASPVAKSGRENGGNDYVNKDLPLNPDERAGLREQKRHYTKELEAKKKKPEIDPNHAYPDFKNSTTLILCKFLSYQQKF
jgi:hypothetical protein